MTQGEIARILNHDYPKYLSFRDVMRLSGRSKTSVLRCLKQMRKREEIEIKVIFVDETSHWKNLYRYTKKE